MIFGYTCDNLTEFVIRQKEELEKELMKTMHLVEGGQQKEPERMLILTNQFEMLYTNFNMHMCEFFSNKHSGEGLMEVCCS